MTAYNKRNFSTFFVNSWNKYLSKRIKTIYDTRRGGTV